MDWENFYFDCKEKGLDLCYCGNWQEKYAKMIVHLSDIIEEVSDNKTSASVIDIGCACGSILKGFKETKVFSHYIGLDISKTMIELGKEKLEFSNEELFRVDITNGLDIITDESIMLVHCSNVLEYIDPNKIDEVLQEMKRILDPNGYILLNIKMLKIGQKKEELSNVNLTTMLWWKSKFSKYFKIDTDLSKRFKNTKFSPTNDKNTFPVVYPYWNLIGLQKK